MPLKWQQTVRNGLDVLELVTPASSCDVALHGAQVLSFTPRGDRDWLWVSQKARWNVGSALRGGVPICFPWFGPHPTEPSFPAHGFARTRVWRLIGVEKVDGGRLQAELELHADERTLPLFPHRFRARTTVIVGDDLQLAFDVANEGHAPFQFETALHSYFSVSDLAAISVEGLAGSAYVDKVAGGARRQPDAGSLRIVGEGRSRLRRRRSGDAGRSRACPVARDRDQRRGFDRGLESGRRKGARARRPGAGRFPALRLHRIRQRRR